MILSHASYKIDFSERNVEGWYIVNDGVMGGLSKGIAELTDEGIRFTGRVSLENNGGFTSLRSPFQRYDLSAYKEFTIRYRSKGVRLAFQMENDRRFYYPNFKIHLASSEEWTTETFQLSEVQQYRMGYPTGGLMQSNDQSEIIRVGFITDEKRAGDFDFEVAYIEFK